MSLFSRRPSAEDVAKRLLILQEIRDYAMFVPVMERMIPPIAAVAPEAEAGAYEIIDRQLAELSQKIQQDRLWPLFTDFEKQFIRSTRQTMSDEQFTGAIWFIEDIQVLAWALGFVPRIPPYDEQADPSFLKSLSSIDLRNNSTRFSLRPKEQIDQARVEAELWHWRSRTRQLIEMKRPFESNAEYAKLGIQSWDDCVRFSFRRPTQKVLPFKPIDEDFPVFGKAYRDMKDEEWQVAHSIALERHYSLNWLCGMAPKNKWDETPTPT